MMPHAAMPDASAPGPPPGLLAAGVPVAEGAGKAPLDPQSLAGAVGSAGHPLLVVDRQGDIVYANAAAGTLFGRSIDALVGTPFGYPVGDGVTTEIEVLRPAGTGRAAEPRVAEMHVAASTTGDQALWVITLYDVTEQRGREAGRQGSDERLATALMAGDYALWDVDLAAGRAYLSDRGRAFFGIDPETPVAGPADWLARVHPEDRPAVQRALEAHLAGRTDGYEAEYRVQGANGDHWLLDRGQVVERALDGGARRLIGTTMEVTSRRERELALADSKRFLETLLDTIPSPVFYKDLHLRYIGCNQAFADFLDRTPDTVAGRTAAEVVDADADWHESMDRTLLAGGSVQTYECDITVGGRTRHFLVSKTLFTDREGRAQGIIGVMLDITNRHAVRHELERSNAELEQFAYIASHDLQEPLRMVVSYLQLLERRLETTLDGTTRLYMDYAVSGAKRMRSMIQDLLSYSRSGNRGRPMTPVPLEACFADAVANLEQAIADADATVTADALPWTTGDKPQLTSLFQNLISNAIKYRATQRPPRITVSADHHAGEAVITVADNGRGIPAERAEKVFDIFYREHGQKGTDGTGIGLAVCRRIVERHGGRIWLEPGQPHGTLARFTLPAGSDTGDSGS